MAKVKIQGNASGTGILTVTAPNTSTDRTITLPDEDVTLGAATPSIDDNGNATAITIDSDENVLIGKTTTALSTAGLTLGESGFASITRDGYEPLTVNRLSSNGDLAVFSKDGTTVGSIGAVGTEMYIGSPSGSDGFVRFQSLGLLPATSAGANSDATMSLGTSSARWKDLYLEGGAYIGGTGSANKLGDYETGTCTLQYSDGSTAVGSANTFKYTKVGRLVTVTGYLNGTNLSSLSGSVEMRITGFPFTSTMDTTFPYFTRYLDAPTNTINTVGYYANGRTYSVFYFMTDHGAYSSAAVNAFHNTSNDLYFGVTYQAT
jgi:hypothetical protein